MKTNFLIKTLNIAFIGCIILAILTIFVSILVHTTKGHHIIMALFISFFFLAGVFWLILEHQKERILSKRDSVIEYISTKETKDGSITIFKRNDTYFAGNDPYKSKSHLEEAEEKGFKV